MLSSLRLRLAAGVLMSLFAWSAIPAFAQEPLSLAAAQRAATLRSRELAGKEFAAAAARDMSVAAGRLPDPMLQMGIDNLPVTGSDKFNLTSDFMTMRRIGIAQELTREDKRKANAARYEREAEKIDAERQAAIADIQRQSAMAWLDRHFAERMLSAMDQQVAAAKLEIQAARSAYRAGRGTQADLIAAHAALAEMEDRRMEQTQRVARSKVSLVRWVGEAGQGPLADPPALDAPPMDEDSTHHAIDKHPALVALKKQHEVAIAEANIARASKQADWTVEISYAQRGPSFSNMVSIGVSVPLQWDQKRRQDREVSAKLAMANDVLAQQEEAQRMHLAELRTLSSDWRSLRERAERYRNDIVPLSRERLRASLAAYAGGKANLTDLTAARRAELEATLRSLDLEAQAAQIWAQLKFLVPDASLDPVGATK